MFGASIRHGTSCNENIVNVTGFGTSQGDFTDDKRLKLSRTVTLMMVLLNILAVDGLTLDLFCSLGSETQYHEIRETR